jgi:hypothetical protein
MLLKENVLLSYTLLDEAHTSLNFPLEVDGTGLLDGMSDEEIVSALADFFDSKDYRLIAKS